MLFRGESYGWECRVLREGELCISRRFLMREQAERWALEQRADIERGWIDAWEGKAFLTSWKFCNARLICFRLLID